MATQRLPRCLKRALLGVLLFHAGTLQAQKVKLLVQSGPVAGFAYHQGQQVWPDMKPGDRLTLVREPDNPHDGLAIRVEWRGWKLGYLPKLENGAVAHAMDQGSRIEARIARLQPHPNPRQRVWIEVFVVL